MKRDWFMIFKMFDTFIFVERTLVSIYNKSNPGKKNWLTTIDLRNAICIHIKKKKRRRRRRRKKEKVAAKSVHMIYRQIWKAFSMEYTREK